MSTHKNVPAMLPPKPTGKRDFAVNVRFNEADQEALKLIAAYRETTVTELIHYVVSRVALPRLLEEMQQEQASQEGEIGQKPGSASSERPATFPPAFDTRH